MARRPARPTGAIDGNFGPAGGQLIQATGTDATEHQQSAAARDGKLPSRFPMRAFVAASVAVVACVTALAGASGY